MPRSSSRHKSHKQSKHGSKEGRDHSEPEKEDVKKMKDRNEGSVRVSRDSGSSEKRKLGSSSRDNGGTEEEYVASKRRKEKADDRWTAGGDEEGGGATTVVIKEVKGEVLRIDGENKSKTLVDSKRVDGENKSKPLVDSKRVEGEKSKILGDSKSKSSRRQESGSEKKDESVGLLAEKEESKSSTSRVDLKRKSEKDLGPKEVQQNKDSKDKERGLERERKCIQDIKREKEAATVDVEAARKQGEERQGKRGRENKEYPLQDELRNPELEKELERRMRKRGDGSTDKDKYHGGGKESEDGRLSTRGEQLAKDGRYKDEKYKDEKNKDGSSGDKHREDSERGTRHRDDKYREDAERDGRRRDVKYREDGDKDYRHKDNKYREDGERENRHKDEKYREDSERDNRRKDDKYREDGERDRRQRDEKFREDGDRDKRPKEDKYREDGDRDIRHRDDKHHEDGDRDNRHKGDKYHEVGDRDYRRRGDKYYENGERNDRRRDDRHVEDGHMDSKAREEKNWQDVGRDSRYREGMQREDDEKDKRLQDVDYREEQSSRDRTSVKSDIKHLRDESNAAAELHHRKLNNRDASPIFDDQSSRYKDDKGRRRTGDREDHVEIRPRANTKEEDYEGEKILSSMRLELVGDRGRSNSRNTALEVSATHSRRRNSPSSSSHAVKDHYSEMEMGEDIGNNEMVKIPEQSAMESYIWGVGFSVKCGMIQKRRFAKHEESRSREYSREERIRHNVTSTKDYAERAPLSRSSEKTLQKDDIRLVEFSAERHPKEDAHSSPLHLVDKSPSSTSTDRRQLNRSGVRRNLDVEDSGQRSGGSRDAKSPSQADGDNKSVSSPFSRTGNFSNNPRSLLPPPPPFRMGADSPLVLGSFEDDNRSKPNNRHRRIGDHTTGRAQGSPWRGVPNWSSSVPNGYIPFQHGPPPVFHPVMQQFPAPAMFSLRPPSMELNQSGGPYHVPDGDRFSGHGRPLGWRHSVEDPTHGWDASNAVFGDESHIYGRPSWDPNSRNLPGGRAWEPNSGGMWKGHNSGSSTELPSAPDMVDYSTPGRADDVWSGQSSLKAQNDEKHPSAQVESIHVEQSNDTNEKNAFETPKTIPEEMPNLPRKEDACLSHLYLSMLDISPDLTQPELYSQYTNLVGMDQNTVSDEDHFKFLLVEEAMDATANLSDKSSRSSVFPTLNHPVLQACTSHEDDGEKSMTKGIYPLSQNNCFRHDIASEALSVPKVPLIVNLGFQSRLSAFNTPIYGLAKFKLEFKVNLQKAMSLYKKTREVVRAINGDNVPIFNVENLVSVVALDQEGACSNDKPGDVVERDHQEAVVSALNKVKTKMSAEITTDKIDEPVLGDGQEKLEAAIAVLKKVEVELDLVSQQQGTLNSVGEDKSSPPENVEGSDAHSLDKVEEVNEARESKGNCSIANDVNCGLSFFSEVSKEAVMPESVESESVNLSRIHQSPESTH
ncbi:hypothetical protein RHSIM_Rhsim02G0244200 [Rhododendron simsii]|uniref:Uncharacterized protein n=1 Tax=Rhododendron simsii TaxID=118357 RepID=A0A834HFM5_RHOSS|nr:hypothetical protein RHSIM_Rhsim02G0244200 [Rhododendron simsii]